MVQLVPDSAPHRWGSLRKPPSARTSAPTMRSFRASSLLSATKLNSEPSQHIPHAVQSWLAGPGGGSGNLI